MNYKEMAEEYFQQANTLQETIKKYKKLPEKQQNKGLIFHYTYLRYDLLRTGKYLLSKSESEDYMT